MKINNKTKDLEGNKFGLLTVVKFHDYDKHKARYYCLCECGGNRIAQGNALQSGFIKSCGCLKKIRKNKPDNKDSLVGLRSGKLEVLDFDCYQDNPTWKKNSRTQKWKCKCDCGNYCSIRRSSLVSGTTKSCGCIAKAIRTVTPGNLLPKGVAAWRRYYGLYKKAAEFRKIEFCLSVDEFISICEQNCKYCGLEACKEYPTKGKSKRSVNGTIFVNGVDRYDNNKCYILNNCVPCCTTCNKAKASMTIEEWYEWIERFVKFNEK